MELIKETQELLMARKGDWVSIAIRAGVGYEWLKKFVHGQIGDPGFAKVTRLRKVLDEGEADEKGQAVGT